MKLYCDIDSTLNDHWNRIKKHGCGQKAFTESAVMKDTPLPYSVEVMNELAEKYEISYLTARGWDDGTVTKKWLKKHGYPKGEILIVNSLSDKLPVLAEEKPDVFIDDFETGQEKDCHTFHCDKVIEIENLGIKVIYGIDWQEIRKELL